MTPNTYINSVPLNCAARIMRLKLSIPVYVDCTAERNDRRINGYWYPWGKGSAGCGSRISSITGRARAIMGDTECADIFPFAIFLLNGLVVLLVEICENALLLLPFLLGKKNCRVAFAFSKTPYILRNLMRHILLFDCAVNLLLDLFRTCGLCWEDQQGSYYTGR